MDDFAKEVITKMETYEKKEKRQFNKYDMAIGLFYGVGIFFVGGFMTMSGAGWGASLFGGGRASGLRDCHRGLVQPQEHGVQRREHDGHVPLRRNAPARGEQIRSPGDIQFGSGKPVHQPRVHGRAEEARNRHQHGRPRPMP